MIKYSIFKSKPGPSIQIFHGHFFLIITNFYKVIPTKFCDMQQQQCLLQKCNPVTLFHLSWQLGCEGKCKIAIRSCTSNTYFNTLRPRQMAAIFQCIFMNENVLISIKISLKFVPKGQINNIPALVMIMAWHRPGDKPLSEPRLESLLTHIYVTRPQWVNKFGL